MLSEQETRVLARVLEMLGSGQALSQDLEDYVVGYHILGNLVARAAGDVEKSELHTKLRWAEAFTSAKDGENHVSDAMAKAQADISVHDYRTTDANLKEKHMKLRSTREAVQEAIWSMKYLGRQGG